jgi:ketosteroid isomerase-like protein
MIPTAEQPAETATEETSAEAFTAVPTATPKEVVLHYMEILNTGDVEALRGFFEPDAVWTLAGDLPLSRSWHGPEQIFDEFIPAMFARFVPDTVELEFEGVIAEGQRVFAEWNTRAQTRSGHAYDQHCLAVFTIRDGRIAEVREYLDTLHAHRAVFS